MLRTLLFLVFIVVGVGGYLLYDSARVEGGDYAVAEELTELAEDRSAELARARQSCEREVLLAFLAEQERRTEEQPEDVESWRVLAETHLELGLLDDVESAMEIGEPIRDAVSDQLLAHIEGGLAAVERARALGDEHADLYRIEASLIAMHIHDLVSALSVQAAAKAALDRAVEIDGNHPRVQIAAGCRLLFAPPILGGDAAQGLELLLAGSQGLPYDERPLQMIALAYWELEQFEEARAWLARALERTPSNPFTAAVLERIDRGEEEPFSRAIGEEL